GSRWLPVRNPERYAGDVFQSLARARGLVLPPPEVMAARPEGTELARHDSPPLATILRDMLEYSTNLTAEVVGLAASGAGSITASARGMQGWLLGQGVEGRFAFADHSGLSGANAISAADLALVVRLGQNAGLEAMLKPIALRDAEGQKIDSPIRISAKTGTLNFVSTLAGYAQGERGVVFAILTGDTARREAVAGHEAPAGVAPWVKRSKRLQQGLIEGWVTG
ncbi:MAG: D-alanyl-D-alanine carboxypeptidase, partial [Paracoccus sp. (in: a-proteobacteria)]|nr:D-alanyl-D-alanine carboxypeptidase [Paracoccus sp. (in: a-proteobacteria)]